MWRPSTCCPKHPPCYNSSCVLESSKVFSDYVQRYHGYHGSEGGSHYSPSFCSRSYSGYREMLPPYASYQSYSPHYQPSCSYWHSRLPKYHDGATGKLSLTNILHYYRRFVRFYKTESLRTSNVDKSTCEYDKWLYLLLTQNI